MKKRIFILLSLFAAATIRADTTTDTTTTEWWYKPNDGYKQTTTVLLTTATGTPIGGVLTFSADQSVETIYSTLENTIRQSGETQSAKNAYILACKALAQSIKAEATNARQDEKIKTLGDTLETILFPDTQVYRDETGAIVGKYQRDSSSQDMVKSIKAAREYVASSSRPIGSQKAQEITYTVRKDMFNDKNISLQTDGEGKSYALRGFTSLDNTEEDIPHEGTWAFSLDDFWFPITRGKDYPLKWGRWNGFLYGCFSNGADEPNGTGNQPLYLKGWKTANNCEEDIQGLITNKSDGATGDRLAHKVLMRYAPVDSSGRETESPTIHWVPFKRDALEITYEADGHSIEHTPDSGGQSASGNKFRLKGFDAANTAATDNPKNAKIPMADGSTDLAWKKPSELFAENADRSASELMAGDGVDDKEKYGFLVGHEGEDGGISLLKVPVGNILDGTSWTTNWTEAIRGIAQSEAESVVNWNTNWVRLAESIASSKEETERFVSDTLNWTTNWYASTEQLRETESGVRDYINGQLDVITNLLAGISGVVDSHIGDIESVRDYVQSVIDIQTNFITNIEFAKLNASVEDTSDFVNKTFDILTNQIAGIQSVVDSGDFASVQSVRDYVQVELGIQTNEMISIIKALDGGVADSTTKLIEAKYDILTNMIAGIQGVIESGDFDTVRSVREYVQEVMNLQTNEMMAVITALDNGVADSAKELIEAKYDILTNQIAGIMSVIESGDVSTINTVGDYIQEVVNIQTNFITNIEFAKLNDVVGSTKELVDYNFDILTNQIAGIKEIIESGDIETIETVSDYIERVIEIQKNFVPVENWTYVTNYVFNYLGGYGQSASGEPLIEPENDPYSGEYESKPITDALLPVRNAQMIVAITNTPLEKINAEKLLDFTSVNTNAENLVQVAGFDGAEDDAFPVKKRGTDGEPDRLEWVEFPSELLMITTNNIAEITAWMRENNVTNIFTSVVTNSDALKMMTTNLFGYVRPDRLLDDTSVWTNGERKVEVKGFSEAAVGTYPVKETSIENNEDLISWKPVALPDSEVIKDVVGSLAGYNRSLESIDGYGVMNATNVWQIYGFGDAVDFSIPSVSVRPLEGESKVINWITATNVVTNDGSKLTLQNYDSAAAGSVATKGDDGKLEWQNMPVPDSSLFGEYNRYYNSIEKNYYLQQHGATNVFSIYGFEDADDGQIPVKKVENNGGLSFLEWRDFPKPKFDDITITTNIFGQLTLKGSENAQTNSIPVLKYDDYYDEHYFDWVPYDEDSGSCPCPKRCPIHDEDYVNGFCPMEGCPHSMGGVGISTGANGGSGSLDDI